jgi:hypothetical protein
MTTEVQRGSATIYQFPPRGRFAAGNAQAVADRTMQRAANISFGDSWYHDEAIKEERARKS